jgi:hypothetical protein
LVEYDLIKIDHFNYFQKKNFEFLIFNIWLMGEKKEQAITNHSIFLFVFLEKEYCIQQSPRNSSSNWSGLDHHSIHNRNIFMSYWIIKLVRKRQNLSNVFLRSWLSNFFFVWFFGVRISWIIIESIELFFFSSIEEGKI